MAYPPYAAGPYAPYGQPYVQPYGPPYGWSPYGAGYPAGPWGPAPWAPGPPPAPRRPGQVIGSAVLALVQAAFVVLASLYVWFMVSLVGFAASQAPGTSESETAQELVSEGNVLLIAGLVSAVLLVVAGIAALTRRSRTAWLLLVGAHAVQVLLALYWGVRVYSVLGDVPGQLSEGAFASFALFFAAGPLVGLGLVLLGPGRRWYDGTARA